MRLLEMSQKELTRHLFSGGQPIAESIVPVSRIGNLRKWHEMPDCALKKHAEWLILNDGYRCQSDLRHANLGLYYALKKRGLLGKIRFEKERVIRRWGTDDEVLEAACKLMDGKGIAGKKEFYLADPGLFMVLKRRNLLDKVRFKEIIRPWGDNNEIVAMALAIVKENSLTSPYQIDRIDPKLYNMLCSRGLLGRLGFKPKPVRREWNSIEELLEAGRKLVEERGIENRFGLEQADRNLYRALKRRGLLDQLGFKKAREVRSWGSDEEVLKEAKKLMEEKGVRNKRGLLGLDPGLYAVLQRRGLLDRAFEEMEQAGNQEAIDGVIDALGSFGDGRPADKPPHRTR